MKRRLLSICMALALCLTLLPVTALAADEPVQYIERGWNGSAVTETTGDIVIHGGSIAAVNALGASIGGGASYSNKLDYVWWDGSNNTPPDKAGSSTGGTGGDSVDLTVSNSSVSAVASGGGGGQAAIDPAALEEGEEVPCVNGEDGEGEAVVYTIHVEPTYAVSSAVTKTAPSG